MKIKKSELQEIVRRIVAKALKENLGAVEQSKNPEVETQLEDAIGILEMISQRIMNFPVDSEKAALVLSSLIENLEKIDGFLGKFVQLQEKKSK